MLPAVQEDVGQAVQPVQPVPPVQPTPPPVQG